MYPGGWSQQTAPPPPGGWAPPPSGPGGWAPYPAGYDQHRPAKTEKLSVWALVLGIASFIVLPVIAAVAAIIVGSKGKGAIRDSNGTRTGTGMATAGQALGWLNIAATIVAVVLIGVGVQFFAHHKSYTSLTAGDCFDRSTGGLSSLVTTVPCAKPHQQEAVGSFDYPGDTSGWPGTVGFATAAASQCQSLALAYLVNPDPALQLVYVYPNRRSWDNGTRKVVCSVRNRDGTDRTGSARGGLGPTTNG